MHLLRNILIAFLAFSGQLRAQLIPFPDFYVSVETNDFLTRNDRKTALSVSVGVSRSNGAARTKTEVNCYEFDAGGRGFDERDQERFLQASSAAKQGNEFAATIVSPALIPREIETSFRSENVEGRYVVKVTRGEKKAVFEPGEGERLVHALAEARAGEAWFQSLLNNDVLPTPTEESHPPRSHGYFVISRIGEVGCRGFKYRISLDCSSYRQPLTYSVGHSIEFGDKSTEQWGSIGLRGDELFKHLSEALDSVEQNREYLFVPEDRRFKIEANRENREVDVTVARSDFFADRSPVVGHVGRTQLEQIGAMISETSSREKWFRAHETLFFQPSE
jgi:hypothetical protein